MEHVGLAEPTRPMPPPSSPLRLKPLRLVSHGRRGWPLCAGTTIKGLVRELLELSSQLPGGMDDVCVARGQADTSALADAYRAALGASKAATEKRRWHSMPSTRLRRAAKPWRMRRDS